MCETVLLLLLSLLVVVVLLSLLFFTPLGIGFVISVIIAAAMRFC